MLYVKDRIEKETEFEIAAFKKKAEHEIWGKMANAMAELGADKYTAGAVEKAFGREKREGFPHRISVDAVISEGNSAGTAQSGHDDDEGDDKLDEQTAGEELKVEGDGDEDMDEA
jgi:hypothetical protein